MSEDTAYRFPAANDRVQGGGGGPYDPSMEPRIASLEADMKDVKGALSRIEGTVGRIEETLKHMATKADVTKVEGAVSTLEAKTTALDARTGRIETTVAAALHTAVGKAIGPVQFVGIMGSAVVVVAATVGLYGWMIHQPWFPH